MVSPGKPPEATAVLNAQSMDLQLVRLDLLSSKHTFLSPGLIRGHHTWHIQAMSMPCMYISRQEYIYKHINTNIYTYMCVCVKGIHV